MTQTARKTRAQIEDIYPLSASQQGILLDAVSLSEIKNSLNNNTAQYSEKYTEIFLSDIAGEFDMAAFRQAWQAVIQRHTALRTGFLWKNRAEPLQFVLKQASLDVAYQDWRACIKEEQEARQQAYLQDLVIRGLPLSKPPLMHLALFHLTDQAYRFLWASHHIILDGWCTPLILGEVLAFYQAQRRGQKCILRPAPPYRRYIDWLNRQDTSAAQAFWQEYLQGFDHPTALGKPVEHAEDVDRVANTKNRYHDINGVLCAETGAILQQLAQQQKVTLSTAIQCVWALLLCRYSGQTDVLFGATVSGRPSQIPNVESMIGLFINTLPIRMEVVPGTMFPEWLTQCQQQRFVSDDYAYCSAGQIHTWSQLPGALPLFHSLLVFQNYPEPSTNSQNNGDENVLEFSPIGGHGARTPYPLTMMISPIPSGQLFFHLIYDRHYLCDEDVAQILEHWQTLLQAIASNPHQSLQKLIALIPTAQIPNISVPAPLSTPYVAPRTFTEVQLVKIWEEILGIQPIGVEDNFFDRGGHSLLATQLVHHMRQTLQRDFSLQQILKSPTIRGLLREVDEGETASTSFVPLRTGDGNEGNRAPLFLIHPAGGLVFPYSNLLPHLDSKQPVYALQARGIYDDLPLFESLEALASAAIQEIKTIQPHGPVAIGGWSFGGLVAFEIARQLRQQDVEVGHLAVIDMYPNTSDGDIPTGPEELQAFIYELGDKIGGDYRSLSDDLFFKAMQQEQPVEWLLAHLVEQGHRFLFDQAVIKRIWRTMNRNGQLMQAYRPQHYEGIITLFSSEESALEDGTQRWQALTSHPVETVWVSGKHHDMLQVEYVEKLGRELEKRLQQVRHA